MSDIAKQTDAETYGKRVKRPILTDEESFIIRQTSIPDDIERSLRAMEIADLEEEL